jgi:hypothetical protein
MPLTEAQRQLDHTIPLPRWMPERSVLLGAFFPLASPVDDYPSADPQLRPHLLWQARMRPVGLAYQVDGVSLTILRSSITVAVSRTAASTTIARGLDLASGESARQDDFEYVVRRNARGTALMPGVSREATATIITWRYLAQTSGERYVVDMLWSVSGTLSEETLVRIAREFR